MTDLGEYDVVMDVRECAELRATLKAAETNADRQPRPAAALPAELHPVFEATVDLEPDDDAQTQTGNAEYALEHELARMKEQGIVRDYTLRRG